VQMIDLGSVEVLQDRHVKGGELVPFQGNAHEDSGHALGNGLERVQVGTVIIGMPRRVKVVVWLQRGVSPAIGSSIVVGVGTIKGKGAAANNGQSIDEAVGALGELCI